MEPIHYRVAKIDGDYAVLQRTGSEDTILVARALLPLDIEEGTRLLWENFQYTIEE